LDAVAAAAKHGSHEKRAARIQIAARRAASVEFGRWLKVAAMSGVKQMSRSKEVLTGLIVVAWIIVMVLLMDFYFQWQMLKTFGRFLLGWL
jgi:hypothetical protein